MATATKVELTNSTGNPRRYTCADGVAITKGTVLTLSDPRTAAAVSTATDANGYAFAGIASMDKVASDGSTSITAWTSGIFEMTASGAITIGDLVHSVGNGEVAACPAANIASGALVGKCLETAADDEVVNIAVGQIV
jgi:hypothetical protein